MSKVKIHVVPLEKKDVPQRYEVPTSLAGKVKSSYKRRKKK